MVRGRQLTFVETINIKRKRKVDSSHNGLTQIEDLLSSDSENDEFPSQKSMPKTHQDGDVKFSQPKRAKFILDIDNEPKSSNSTDPLAGIPWVEKYSPKTTSQVTLHSRKAGEVRHIMEQMIYREQPRLTILCGPAGSSKSTMVKCLAHEYGYTLEENNSGSSKHLVEWKNPSYTGDGNIMESFADFLNGVQFSNGDHKRIIVLVEDIPNISHYGTRQLFIASLKEWINKDSRQRLPPLVLIFTEVEVPEKDGSYYTRNESIVLERVIPKSILCHNQVKVIKFASVNTLLLTKMLKNIVQQEKSLFSSIPKKEIDSAIKVLSDQGDVRSAINGFEFWARWRQRSSTGGPTGRENQLGLFHALGRIIHGSRKDKNGRPVLSDNVIVESVLQDWSHSNIDGSFSLAVFENYLGANNSQLALKDIARCSEILSLQDDLIAHDPVAASDIVCRGIRQSIRNGDINSNFPKLFRPLAYPKMSRLNRDQTRNSVEYMEYRLEKVQQTGTLLNLQDIILLQGFYVRRNRLGGQITGNYFYEEDGNEFGSPINFGPIEDIQVPQPSSLTFEEDPIQDSEDGE